MEWTIKPDAPNHFGGEPCVRFDGANTRIGDLQTVLAFLETIAARQEWPCVIWNVFGQMGEGEEFGAGCFDTVIAMWVEFTDVDDLAALFRLRFAASTAP